MDAGVLGGLLADLRGAGVLAEVGGGPAARPAEPAPPPGSAAAARAFGAHRRGRPPRPRPRLAVPARDRPQSPLEVLRRRRAATVVVHGADRVGMSVATLLAAAGVGRVHVADRGPVRPGDVAPAGFPAADVDRTRSGAAVEALRRVAPEVQSGAAGARAAGRTWWCCPRSSRSTPRCAAS